MSFVYYKMENNGKLHEFYSLHFLWWCVLSLVQFLHFSQTKDVFLALLMSLRFTCSDFGHHSVTHIAGNSDTSKLLSSHFILSVFLIFDLHYIDEKTQLY
jgi:hypothetical protein